MGLLIFLIVAGLKKSDHLDSYNSAFQISSLAIVLARSKGRLGLWPFVFWVKAFGLLLMSPAATSVI